MHLRSRSRHGAERPKRSHRRAIAGLAIAAVLALLGAVLPALAGPVGTAAGFEDDDGNLAPEAPINFDWNSFAPTTWTGTAPFRTSTKTVSGWAFTGLEDAQATTSDSGFAGGTKQDDECATVTGAKAPNKDDLERVYVASNTVDGDVFLELAWVRIPQNTTSPSAHIGFEFNQSDVPCGPASDGLVERTLGDMLIVYDFEGGATDTPTITLRRWVTSGTCEVSSNDPPCWGPATNLTALGFAEAKVNTFGSVTDQIAPSPPETLGTNEFGEAGINLTDAGVFGTNECVAFGKTFAVSRSSGNSGTAQMKDLVGPGDINITNCGRVIIRKVTDPSPDPTDTTFTYTTTGGLDPATFGLKDGEFLDYGGDVFAGSYSVTEDDPGPNFSLTGLDCSASDTSHGTTVTTDVATRTASFDLKPLDTVDCTYTNTLQRGALRILKQSTKTDTLVANPGATFSVTGSSNFTVVDNDTPAAGSKSDESATVGELCVSGLLPGDYTVNETSPPPGYGGASQTDLTATVVVGTNCTDNEPSDANSATFTNAPLADIQVNFRDGGSGETSATSITCDNTGTTPDTTAASGWDDSVTHEDISIDPSPRTVTCTIVIDP
jgi:hypothetical protein